MGTDEKLESQFFAHLHNNKMTICAILEEQEVINSSGQWLCKNYFDV